MRKKTFKFMAVKKKKIYPSQLNCVPNNLQTAQISKIEFY